MTYVGYMVFDRAGKQRACFPYGEKYRDEWWIVPGTHKFGYIVKVYEKVGTDGANNLLRLRQATGAATD